MTTFEPLSAKQQSFKMALGLVPMIPMLLIAMFWRQSFMAQHFGALAMVSILISATISTSSRVWIHKIK